MNNEITLHTRRQFLRTHRPWRRAVLDSAGVSGRHICRAAQPGGGFGHANRHRQGRDDSCRAANGRRQRWHQHCRSLRQRFLSQGTPDARTFRAAGFEFERRDRLSWRAERIQRSLRRRDILPWCRASVIPTRTGRTSARRKSGRQPATRTKPTPTAGLGATSTIAAPARTRPSASCLGRELPEAFYAAKPTGICFDNPQNYRFVAGGRSRSGQPDRVEAAYEKLNDAGHVRAGYRRRQFRRFHRHAGGGAADDRRQGF